jgi:hypothetical protein
MEMMLRAEGANLIETNELQIRTCTSRSIVERKRQGLEGGGRAQQ